VEAFSRWLADRDRFGVQTDETLPRLYPLERLFASDIARQLPAKLREAEGVRIDPL
jgi:hypothetical protein